MATHVQPADEKEAQRLLQDYFLVQKETFDAVSVGTESNKDGNYGLKQYKCSKIWFYVHVNRDLQNQVLKTQNTSIDNKQLCRMKTTSIKYTHACTHTHKQKENRLIKLKHISWNTEIYLRHRLQCLCFCFCSRLLGSLLSFNEDSQRRKLNPQFMANQFIKMSSNEAFSMNIHLKFKFCKRRRIHVVNSTYNFFLVYPQHSCYTFTFPTKLSGLYTCRFRYTQVSYCRVTVPFIADVVAAARCTFHLL